MKKILLLSVSFSWLTLFAAETSVFDAGNLNLANPYGLTDNEKAVLKNKQKVQSVESDLNVALEQIQGVSSVLEGVSQRLQKIEQKISQLEARSNSDANLTTTNIEEIKNYAFETRQIQENNYKKINKTLSQLANLIDKKNSTQKQDTKSQDKMKKKSKPDIMNDAIKLINSGKHAEALESFKYLLEQNYKPAASNFYLGEIAYSQKLYSNAIQYYQKSIQLYDKADYIPKLLYHTAISFDKIGDTANANRFYKALKVGYPDTKEAEASPNRE